MSGQQYKYCLAIINPLSTSADSLRSQLKGLSKRFESTNYYKLQKSDFDDPSKLKRAIFACDQNWLIMIIGGDGTVNMVVNFALAGKSSATATLLPLPGGNASDVAHMLNGKHAADVDYILSNGRKTTAYPLRIMINEPDKRDTKLVLAYVSFGASAYTMVQIDGFGRNPRYSFLQHSRATVLLAEAVSSLVSMLKAKRFTLASNNGPAQLYYDVMYLNGSRIAKLYRLHTSLEKPSFTRLAMRRKHPVIISHLFRLIRMRLRNYTLTGQQNLEFHDEAWSQIDGDTQLLPAGTKVTIEQGPSPYNVLSTT